MSISQFALKVSYHPKKLQQTCTVTYACVDMQYIITFCSILAHSFLGEVMNMSVLMAMRPKVEQRSRLRHIVH